MNRIFALIFLLLTGPVMADSYYCDSTVRATTLNVTWNECPRHRWSPYVKTAYDGQTMHGTFYGQGTYTWEDGSVYTGKWREGKMHGWGTLTFPNGDKYVGIWSKDRLLYGDVYTNAENCALRLTTNDYLPHVDACFESTGRCCKSRRQENAE